MAFLGTIGTADAVRAVLGLESDELTDATILSRATRVDTATKQNIPGYQTIIDAELTDPDSYAALVDYVVYTAALYLVPTLPIVLEQTVKDDSGAEGRRFNLNEKALDNLADEISGYLADLQTELNPDTPAIQVPVLMGRSVPSYDPVTGDEQ